MIGSKTRKRNTPERPESTLISSQQPPDIRLDLIQHLPRPVVNRDNLPIAPNQHLVRQRTVP